MEIRGIDNPFDWSRELVGKVQQDGTGMYYSPSRKPSSTSEGGIVSAYQINDDQMNTVRDNFLGYYDYIDSFIGGMKEVFPTLGDDYGVYIPEVKYLSSEPVVNYSDLSLTKYPNVHFVGDALSARGISVSGAQAIYVAENLITQK